MSEIDPEGGAAAPTGATPPAPALPDVSASGGTTGAYGDTELEINDEDLIAAADAMDSHADKLKALAQDGPALVETLSTAASANVVAHTPAPILTDAVGAVSVVVTTVTAQLTALASALASDAAAFRKIVARNAEKEAASAAAVSSTDTNLT